MPCSSQPTPIAYNSYAEFISELAKFDKGYDQLKQFLEQPYPIPRVEPKFTFNSEGSITVIDAVHDELLLQRFPVPNGQVCTDSLTLHAALEERPPESRARIIFVDYFRSWVGGNIVGIDLKILDKIALQHRLHPEILRLHFGCSHGLDESYFPDQPDYVMSPCVARQYFHLNYVHGFLSAHFHGQCTCNNSQSVVILARNENLDNDMEVSGLSFLDEAFPVIPRTGSPSSGCWTNDVFIQKLQSLSRLEAASASQDLIEFIIPYGNIAALTESVRMRVWARKVTELKEENLSNRYSEQQHTLHNIQDNLRELQRFAPEVLRSKYAALLQVQKRLMTVSEEQVESLRSTMSYRASLASLAESRLSVEYSRKGIEYTEEALKQNNRVKRLTQLAFVFIPLSAVTSIFGMNLDVLDSGPAQIWMVVVAVAISYILVLSFWTVLSTSAPEKLRRWTRSMQGKAGDNKFRQQRTSLSPPSDKIDC